MRPVERTERNSKTYKYSLLDSRFQFLTGYSEIRWKEFFELEQIYTVEINESNERTIVPIKVDDFKVSKIMELNKPYQLTLDWNLVHPPNSKCNLKSSRKLTGSGDLLNYSGEMIPTVEVQTTDLMVITNPEVIYKNVVKSVMEATYGKEIGLMKVSITYENDLNSTATLKTIYRGEDVRILKEEILGVVKEN